MYCCTSIKLFARLITIFIYKDTQNQYIFKIKLFEYYMETLKGDEWGSKNLYKTMRLKGLVNQDNAH